LPCRRHILPLLLGLGSNIDRGDVLNRALPCIRIAAVLAAVAIVAAGCTAANNAASSQTSGQQATNQSEQPYKTSYGLTNEGPTTDLYTEFFGPRQPPPAPTPVVATTQPAESVTTQPIAPVQQAATPARPAPNQATATTATNRTPQPISPQPPPVVVAQQPASPPPPQEPDVPTAYGITANGPTTDLYTAIFGPRRSDGQ
jgi:hypothetical protein